jgi:hypothetical protein
MVSQRLLCNGALAIYLTFLGMPIYASNLWFAHDMPISAMTDADIEIFSSAVDEALNDAADGDTRHWKNPETGAGGDLTLLSTSEKDGMRCRRLQIANEAKRKTARSDLDFCRQDDGSWKVRPSSAPKAR